MTRISDETYIQTVYEMIVNCGLEEVSIRKIAKKLNCSSATLYRHFESLEHLISFASIRFLRPYIEELKIIVPQKMTLDTYLKVWESFAKISFANPKIYNGMFFGQYSNVLAKTIKIYYSMFHSEIDDIDEVISRFLVESDFNKRDLMLLESCTADEKFTKQDLELISNLCVHLYKGMLKTILDNIDKVDNITVQRFLSELMSGIHFIIDSVKNKSFSNPSF